MSRNLNALICLISFSVCLSAPSFLLHQAEAEQSETQPSAQSAHSAPLLQGQASALGVLTQPLQVKMGFRCSTDQYEELVITEIIPQTAASLCSLQPNDKILDAQLVDDALDLTIERDNKTFKARLRALQKNKPQLTQQKAIIDNTPRKPYTLNAEQSVMRDNQLVPEQPTIATRLPRAAIISSKQFELEANQTAKILADYNLELLVDRSMSMGKPDCPGNLSRWHWCGMQAAQLAKSLRPYTANGLTVVTFATEYDVFEHASPENIERLFKQVLLQSGTRLFEPLCERLDNFFVHRKPNSKPLMIVIITDGVPSPRFEPALVRAQLVSAGQKMTSARDVTVIFSQIGSQDQFGQRYLADLEQNLGSYGARYRFVHVVNFDTLQDRGLGPALVASIRDYSQAPKTK